MGNSAGSLKNHIATAEKTGALNFTEKKLDEFPTALAKTGNTLRSLDLSKNRIPSLPGGVIGAFKMLKTLKIDENRLALLPPEIGNLVKLETLIVAGNLLTYLPETLASLKSLKELDAHQNHIKVFPRSILSLPKLDMVNLSRNKLEQLEGDFSEFSATELNVNQNQITTLAPSISQCGRLKTLRLEENCLALEAIHREILTESKISTLQLAGNLFDDKKLVEVDGYSQYMDRFTATRRKMD